MIEIKKVNSADFKKVFPLLKRFNETKISKSDWKKIFENRFTHVAELNRLGANIRIKKDIAYIEGDRKLLEGIGEDSGEGSSSWVSLQGTTRNIRPQGLYLTHFLRTA